MGGDVAGEQRLAGVDGVAHGGDAHELVAHTVEEGLGEGEFEGPHLVPLAAAHLVGQGQAGVGGEGAEEAVGQGAGEGVEGVVVAVAQLVDIDLPQLFADVEAAEEVGAHGQEASRAVALVGLHHAEVAHEVEIDGFWHTHVVPHHGIDAVVRHIHGAHEAEVAFARRHEGELDAAEAVEVHRVGDVVVVEGVAEGGGEGADEAHRHERDVVLVDIYGGEEEVEVLVEAFLREVHVDAVLAVGGDEGAHTAVDALLRAHALVDGEVEDVGAVELGLIDIFLHEGEMLPEEVLLIVGVELVEAHVELLEFLAAEMGLRHDAVLLLVCDDLLGQLHGGVALAAVAVFGALGGDFHLLEGAGRGFEGDADVLCAALGHGHREGLVAHHAELHEGVGEADGEVEAAVDVGHRAQLGVRHEDLHEGHRLARDVVGHRARYRGGLVLPPRRRRKEPQPQRQPRNQGPQHVAEYVAETIHRLN